MTGYRLLPEATEQECRRELMSLLESTAKLTLAHYSVNRFLVEGNPLTDVFLRGEGGDYELNGTIHYRVRFTLVRNKELKVVGKITFVNITDRVQMEHRLKEVASVDSLTRLCNRNALLEESESSILQFALTGDSVSVMMFDIDQFKEVNDSFGHDTGNMALVHVRFKFVPVSGLQVRSCVSVNISKHCRRLSNKRVKRCILQKIWKKSSTHV